ncbi:glycosyltransferase [Candidatus Uabimicrobium sp. HlEnr_7]|uniref:glycosyltransferase n=1 Tax=Candidatus Uabimicrobium helgolandensis TaxID=3095367 RepID=UPI003555FBE4
MISIILPVYNAAEFICDAVGSIQDQTYRDYELIIIDDGSTDTTANLLQQLQKRDTRIRIITSKKNKGIVDALNTGIRNACYPYIARMDADDFCYPQRLELQYQFLQDNPQVGAVSCLVKCEMLSENKGMQNFVAWTNTLLSDNDIYRYRFVETPVIHPSVMFRKQLIDKYGYYNDNSFPEDYELWLRWLHHGVRIQKIAQCLFVWNDPPTRLTRTDARYKEQAFYACKTHYLAKWLSRKNINNIVIWGAGKKARQYIKLLNNYAVTIEAYIDVDAKKIGKLIQGKPVYHYKENFCEYKNHFILSYVGNRGIRNKITDYLEQHELVNGKNFLLMA